MNRPPTPVLTSVASRARHVLAVKSASALLKAAPLPAGAEPEPSSPVLATAQPPQRSGAPAFVDLVAWWSAPGSMPTVFAWLQTQVPGGARYQGQGSLLNGAVAEYGYVMYSFPAVPPILTSRLLLVTVAPINAHSVAIRVDAQIIWDPARSGRSLVDPAAVSSITVIEQTALPTSDGVVVPFYAFARVTNPRLLHSIVKVFDGLPVDDNGPGCNLQAYGPGLTMTFIGQDNRTVATAVGDENSCTGLALVVDDKPQASVDDPNFRLFDLVEPILGFSPPSG